MTYKNSIECLADVGFYVINMDSATDRLRAIEAQFAQLGLKFIRVPAIKGTDVISDFSPEEKARFLTCHGREIKPGELGCYLSHLAAMETFLQSNHQIAIILEDDAVLPLEQVDFKDVLSLNNRKMWDFIRLQSRRRSKFLHLADLNSTYILGLNVTRSTGATGYGVNRKAAESLLTSLKTIEVPFDHAFDRPHHFGIKYRHIFPNFINYSGAASTIETYKANKLTGLRKLPTFLWRARSETGRFLWSVKEYIEFVLHTRIAGSLRNN